MPRGGARLNEISVPKLASQRDHGRSHRPVFMRALRPGYALLGINPNRKPHALKASLSKELVLYRLIVAQNLDGNRVAGLVLA